MNSTASHNAVSTTPGRHDHPPQSRQYRRERPARRVSLLDRAALHLGVALIKWGRRPLDVESRERRARRVEQQIARLERERATERWVRLNLPQR
ncbi:hypothetical protein [Lacisediminihabitans profunda]|uniref:Uncharacterized protein n=1 Tax=Lacisediminihabitans profunda TaxID=2594790 RepID=A0A5C8UPS8_9MICO|nr:hypothetical protein [Lacisediminihabitans profunda]TXN29881.1 hypothetical protein FVP33_12135 [Lacisediminihabitans profunda]